MDGHELGRIRALAVHGSDAALLAEGRLLISKLIDQIDEARNERDEARRKRDEARQERKKWAPVDPIEYCVPVDRHDFSAALYGHVINKLFRGTDASAVCRMIRKYHGFMTKQDLAHIVTNIDRVLVEAQAGARTLGDAENHARWLDLHAWLKATPYAMRESEGSNGS